MNRTNRAQSENTNLLPCCNPFLRKNHTFTLRFPSAGIFLTFWRQVSLLWPPRNQWNSIKIFPPLYSVRLVLRENALFLCSCYFTASNYFQIILFTCTSDKHKTTCFQTSIILCMWFRLENWPLPGASYSTGCVIENMTDFISSKYLN